MLILKRAQHGNEDCTIWNMICLAFAGPYTIFAPTDKAFRSLLVQLGGPDKAEEKFKENPRLLSGVRCISLLYNTVQNCFLLVLQLYNAPE
jgi:hypothetical protein